MILHKYKCGMEVIKMKLSMEKEYLVNESNTYEVDYFNSDLRELNYEDHEEFISDFINDIKLLFMNCNNIQFENIINDYDVDENLFDV